MSRYCRYPGKKALVLLFFSLVLVGCGSEDSVTVQGGKVLIDATEYRFSPSTINIKPGKLEITVRNRGALAHNLTILRGKKRYLVKRLPTFQKGSRTLTVNLKHRTTYSFISSLGKDEELGLRGKIVVH